jgi:hypothetical protein
MKRGLELSIVVEEDAATRQAKEDYTQDACSEEEAEGRFNFGSAIADTRRRIARNSVTNFSNKQSNN